MPSPRPYPRLADTFDLPSLWMLRMLVELGALDGLFAPRVASQRADVFVRLGLPLPPAADTANAPPADMRPRLAATLRRLEQRADELHLPDPLEGNLRLMQSSFGLSVVEGHLLAMAVLAHADALFHCVARNTEPGLNLSGRLSRIVGADIETVLHATRPTAPLRRCGLVDFQAGGPIAGSIELRRGGLRAIAQVPLRSSDELLGHFLVRGRAPSLAASDFEHLELDVGTLANVVREANGSNRLGVNILLYGPPGTGKSELSRLVARVAGADLYEVAVASEDGKPQSPTERLNALAACSALLAGRQALLSFDETDALFREGAGSRSASAADVGKAFLTDLLEVTPVPTVWIANCVRGIDPALVRRFDAVVRVDVAPRRQRLALIERECAGLLGPQEAHALADVPALTPAVVTRAAAVARRVLEPAFPTPLVKTLVEGILRAQGHGPVGHASQTPLTFDPAACNADVDLAALAARFRHANGARICLSGPPGTGKTEFGRWLAEELGRPHLTKRLSDLQSPWVGETERAIAAAFHQARREGAVLQFDEVDSFLGDRSAATRSWEVSQVNELLTQLETFDGFVIATTNRFETLDPASMRRFDYRIRMDYLTHQQALLLTLRCTQLLALEPCDLAIERLRHLTRLAPGDFAVAMRRQVIERVVTLKGFMDLLEAEASYKKPEPRRIGLV